MAQQTQLTVIGISGRVQSFVAKIAAQKTTYIVFQNNRLEIWVKGLEVMRLNTDGSVDVNGAVNQNAF